MTKADWLRSEIEKLEGVKLIKYRGFPLDEQERGFNQALTFIITRYKEELLELENHP